MANVNRTAMIVEYGIIAPSLYTFDNEADAKVWAEKMDKQSVKRITLKNLRVYTAIEAVDPDILETVVWEAE